MILFVRRWDQNKFISNPHQHAKPKFSGVIIISYQRLSDKHALKNKFKIRKTTFKMSTTKFETKLLSGTTFSLYSLFLYNMIHDIKGLILYYFIWLPQMIDHFKNVVWLLLSGKQMIFKDLHHLCYWLSQNLTAARYIFISISPVQNFLKKVITVTFNPLYCCEHQKNSTSWFSINLEISSYGPISGPS